MLLEIEADHGQLMAREIVNLTSHGRNIGKTAIKFFSRGSIDDRNRGWVKIQDDPYDTDQGHQSGGVGERAPLKLN